MKLGDIRIWVQTASLEDLREINHVVDNMIKSKQLGKVQEAMQSFRIGQKVTFYHHRTGDVVCIIEKLNVKTATVKEVGTGKGWRVNPSILKPA